MWQVQIDFVLNADAWSARMLGTLAMLAANLNNPQRILTLADEALWREG
jgi:hypothetical protein